MSFANAHNFVIQNFSAVEIREGGQAYHRLLQEACLGAGHQSTERYDAPKCHPDTRKALIRDIMNWVDLELCTERILWMSGPAGAGKSSISQTLCDRCHDERKLLASFFFSRTATGTGRDNGNRLVPTIACQLANMSRKAKALIINELETDAAVLSYSMAVQMEKLVLEPLSQLRAKMDEQEWDSFPYLVVIDGLDECNDPRIQSRIVTMIAAIFSKTDVRLRFIITSRPELEIRNTFELPSVTKRCVRIILDEHYKPSADIFVYLQSEFESLKREHTLKSALHQESAWPTVRDINGLVDRSSGQFIYASTIMKFLSHPRRDPRDALRSIMEYKSNVGNDTTLFKESPFAQLDALYKQILNVAVTNFQGQLDSITIVFQVILFKIRGWFDHNTFRSTSTIASFMSIAQSKLELLLTDLHSIISIPKDDNDFIHFYHASFEDFLKDLNRSGVFYVNEKEAHIALARQCLRNLSKYQLNGPLTVGEEYSCYHYFSHIKESGFDDSLLKELYDTSRFRPLLDVIIHPEARTSLVLLPPSGEEISVFLDFDFREGTVDFARPKHWNCKDICERMERDIDEIILASYSSFEEAEKILPYAIIDIVRTRKLGFTWRSNLHRCWLAMLFEIPERGKHLYMDSTKCLHMYKRFCSMSNFKKYISNDLQQLMVLKYLLNRIKPSPNIDPDVFWEISVELSYNERLMREKVDEVNEFWDLVYDFTQKCSQLRNSHLGLVLGSIEDNTIYAPPSDTGEDLNLTPRQKTCTLRTSLRNEVRKC